MAWQLHRISQYYIVAQYTIVVDVSVCNKQAVHTDAGNSRSLGSTSYSNTFSYGHVIANGYGSHFPIKFEVLRYGRDYRSGKNTAVFADFSPFHNGNIGTDPGTFSNFHIFMYGHEGFYCH